MTCIIGMVHEGTVYMGGDSCALDGWTRFSIDERKVFRLGDLLIGGSGLLHAVQTIRLLALIPEHPEGMRDQMYLVSEVMPALKQCLDQAGSNMIDESTQTALMLGYRGNLYYVTPALCVVRPDTQVYALGSGGDIGLGAMLAFRYKKEIPRMSIIKALEISGQFNATVAPPYYVEALEPSPAADVRPH